MREIQLTRGYIAIVDDDDYERVSKLKWTALEDRRKDGSLRTVYPYHSEWIPETGKPRNVRLNRFILNVTDETLDVDHRNHNGLDNRKLNLRVCGRSNNLGNSVRPVNNTSGYKGVVWDKVNRKWRAQIGVNGKSHPLGRFSTKEEAACAYDEAALRQWGEFALTNKAMRL